MDYYNNMWTPALGEAAKRQLISEEEEMRRLAQSKAEAMEKLRKEEELDVIVEAQQDTTTTEENASTPQVPSRQDLYNMCLQLQKQIRTLEDKVYSLQDKNINEQPSQ